METPRDSSMTTDTEPFRGTVCPEQRRALLVGVSLPAIPLWEAEDSLDELARLAATATLTVAGRIVQHRHRVDPTYYVGSGKARELCQLAARNHVDLIVFDNDLSPAQMRNLERLSERRILDRSGLILDIFARHARTRAAQIQVELAQLNYLLPRLTRQWTHLSRQAGGGAIRGMGAVGVRGPGETQLETDRRIIRRRIRDLRARLHKIGTQMATGRKARRGAFKVALVGYTNAGKSTLMRALSGADVGIQDQLFATLDSTTRSLDLGGHQQILLTDTVGFIKRLPHHLLATFRTTLEDTMDADLLLHVIDLSHPRFDAQIRTVEQVLRDLGLEERPTLKVYNKVDQVVSAAFPSPEDPAITSDGLRVSALTGAGLDTLRQRILTASQTQSTLLDLIVPQHEGRLLAQLEAHGNILRRSFHGDAVHLRVSLSPALAGRWDLQRFAARPPAETDET